MIQLVDDLYPLVSIVILSWNRKEDLDFCLGQIRKVSYPNIEIIVVDNGSRDGSVTMVENEYREVNIIKLPRNIGIEGFNVGCWNAKGKYVVVLDDDSYPDGEAITRLVEKIEQDETIAVVGAKIINPRNGKVYTKGFESFDVPYTSFWGGGAVLRKKAVIECGMYDHRLFVYTNEYDLSMRLIRGGYSVRYDPEAIIYHTFSSVSRFSSTAWLWGRNEIWFNLRYIPLRYLPITLPRSAAWMIMSSKHSLKEILYKMYGLFNGFATFPYWEREPVSKDVVQMLLKNHWTFVPPLRFLYHYLRNRRK